MGMLQAPKGPSGNTSSSFCFPKGETAPDALPPPCLPQVKPQVLPEPPPPLCLPQVKPQVKNAKLEVFPNSPYFTKK